MRMRWSWETLYTLCEHQEISNGDVEVVGNLCKDAQEEPLVRSVMTEDVFCFLMMMMMIMRMWMVLLNIWMMMMSMMIMMMMMMICSGRAPCPVCDDGGCLLPETIIIMRMLVMRIMHKTMMMKIMHNRDDHDDVDNDLEGLHVWSVIMLKFMIMVMIRPQRSIETIASIDQWSGTIKNH